MTEYKTMSVDIREYTRVIVLKNRQYLVGRDMICRDLKWSPSPWEAWWTRDMDDARRLADRVGGVPVLFNPIVGETKELCQEERIDAAT